MAQNVKLKENKGFIESSQRPTTFSMPEPYRYELSGRVSEEVVVSEDKGYVLWFEPRGTARLLFKYGNTGYEFIMYLDPAFPGVAVRSGGREIYDGVQDLRDEHPQLGNLRLCQDKMFKMESVGGVIVVRLEAVRKQDREWKNVLRGFRLNYTMLLPLAPSPPYIRTHKFTKYLTD